MIFGDTKDFAIEAYHEPSSGEWGGIGRLCIYIQGMRLGDIGTGHCSLFHATERFRELIKSVASLWKESFTGLCSFEIFGLIDRELYANGGAESDWDYAACDFLTNTGEMFNGTKTFITCDPAGRVYVLYQLRDGSHGSGVCDVEVFRAVAGAYVRWFEEQRQVAVPASQPRKSSGPP